MAVNAPPQFEDKVAFTAISPRQHVLTIIIITSHLIGPHDVAMNTA